MEDSTPPGNHGGRGLDEVLPLVTSSRGVYVRLPILRFIGSGSAAVMLAQTLWLLADNPHGEVVRGDHEWDADTGLSSRQARRARDTLVKEGVVTVEKRQIDGAPKCCLRLRGEGLARLFLDSSCGQPMDARTLRGESIRPNGQVDDDQTVESSSLLEVVEERSSRSAPDVPDEVDRLCGLLADLVAGNGAKRPTVTTVWRQECDRMIRLDGRTVEQIEACIRWCQADDFWSTVVLSMPKVRKHFDQMGLQAKKRRAPKPDAKAGAVEYARRKGLL